MSSLSVASNLTVNTPTTDIDPVARSVGGREQLTVLAGNTIKEAFFG